MRYFIITILAVLFVACGGNDEKNVPNNQQSLNEFYVEEDTTITDVQPQTDVVEVSDNQTFTLSLDNLNEYLSAPDQKVLFAFKTKNGKVLSLLTDAQENYLVYRFGVPQNVELQYPDIVDENSWKKFYFEGYKSSAVNLMHIQFVRTNYEYVIYYNKFYSSPEDNKVGVQVKPIDGQKVDIRGDMGTIKGSLDFFRFNEKIRHIPEKN
jgi:hypothetical protein